MSLAKVPCPGSSRARSIFVTQVRKEGHPAQHSMTDIRTSTLPSGKAWGIAATKDEIVGHGSSR